MNVRRISFLCKKVLVCWRNCSFYRVKYTLFCMTLMVFPIPDGSSDSDSSETTITLSGGGGSYAVVSRECSGGVYKQKTSFSEISGSIDHKFASLPLRIGIRSSYINDHVVNEFYDQNYGLVPQTVKTKIFTANPFFHIEGKFGAIGGGYFYADHSIASGEGFPRYDNIPFSIYAQLGSRNGVYFNISHLHSSSIYTQGYLQLGIGTWKNKKADLWFGLGGLGPYDHLGFMAKTSFQVSPTLYLNINGRIGLAEGITEHGFNLGVSYRLVK